MVLSSKDYNTRKRSSKKSGTDGDHSKTIKVGLAKPMELPIFEIYFCCSAGDGTKTLPGKSTTTELSLHICSLVLFLLPQ